MPTSCNDVVDNDHFLPWLDRVRLDLEEVGAIFLLERRSLNRSRELSFLPDRNKRGTQSQGKGWSKQEATSIEPHDNVWLLPISSKNMQFETSDQRLMERGVSKNGEDVFEQNAWRGEVLELSQRRAKLYFKTGEFGGAGGRGGGDGDLGRGDILVIRICLLTGDRGLNAHLEGGGS